MSFSKRRKTQLTYVLFAVLSVGLGVGVLNWPILMGPWIGWVNIIFGVLLVLKLILLNKK